MPSRKPVPSNGDDDSRIRKRSRRMPRDSHPSDDELLLIENLRNRLGDAEEIVRFQRELIKCLEAKERRLRIWNAAVRCPHCKNEYVEFVACSNKKIFHGADYAKLILRLRTLGYFVKEKAFDEKPPSESSPYDGEVEFLDVSKDLRDLPLPGGVGPGLLEDPPKSEEKKD